MIKQFFSIMRRYIKPYRKYLAWSVILNFLSQWLNVFSFTALVPILNILFQTKGKVYEFQEIHGFDKDAIINNAYYYVQMLIEQYGQLWVLVLMGLVLIVMTALKTAAYFASSAIIIPFRTGVVRDIRMQVYDKVLRLPIGFFSEERKGDIVARMCTGG